MKILCISASNILHSKENSVSKTVCNIITEILKKKDTACEIVELREYSLYSCIGCSKCFDSKRCCNDVYFNNIYDKVIVSDAVFFISPHYAPVPAKLCMILEKMEEISFLHWWKDSTYKSEVYGIPAGIISHGGASEWALKSYKAMVNDTIANALDTIQFKVIPYNSEWNTGIALPVQKVLESDDIFPVQEHDWNFITQRLTEYIEIVLREIKYNFNK